VEFTRCPRPLPLGRGPIPRSPDIGLRRQACWVAGRNKREYRRPPGWTPLPQSVSPACGLTWQDGVHYGQAAAARAGCGLGADVAARAEPDKHRSARVCIPPSLVTICIARRHDPEPVHPPRALPAERGSSPGSLPRAGHPVTRPRKQAAAYTVWTRPGDNLYIHKALDGAKPGDVIVVNGGGTSHGL
jgi:hypothetical protein